MTRAFQLIVAFAALALVANAAITLSTGGLTSGSFAASPSTVFDASATTNSDYTVWSALTDIVYGAGADNTTVYAYGRKITSGTTITTVISRKLNATLLSNGTAAKSGDATIGTDSTASPGTTITSYGKMATGLGTMAFAYVGPDSSSCSQVYITIYTGGSTSPVTKVLTTNACAKCVQATTDGAGFDNAVSSIFYENSTYYVSYTTTKYTLLKTASSTDCAASPGTTPVSGGGSVTTTYATYFNGLLTAGTLAYTSAVPTIATTQIYYPSCGPSNYTNSTYFYCTYKDADDTSVFTANTKYTSITQADGTVGAKSGTIATDSKVTGTGSAYNAFIYTATGFIYGLYQQGFLVNNKTSVTTDGSTFTYSNTLGVYNLTSGATATTGGLTQSGFSNTLTGGAYSGAGFTYSQGYDLLTRYASVATNPTYTYESTPYLANGTMNVTTGTTSKVTVATTDYVASGSSFADANGALWFGVYSVDTSNSNAPGVGTLGKLVGQLNYSAGNILASFFAFLSLMIAALFAF